MPEQQLLLSGRVTYTEPSPPDNGYQPLSINQDGRVRVSSKPGLWPILTGDLTAVGNALVVDVIDASNLVLHVKNTGSATMSAGTFAFEGSVDSTNGTDGTWFAIQAVRSNANTIETSPANLALSAGNGLGYAWEMSVNALRFMRVRTTVAVTASSIARWTAIRGSYATEPIPASQPISGSVTNTPVGGSSGALVGVAGTNANTLKGSAGGLSEITVFNPTAAIVYVKVYNKATPPTVGTDTPVFTIPVPVNGLVCLEFGALGKRFTTGISIAITAGPLATDTAAVAAGVQVGSTYF